LLQATIEPPAAAYYQPGLMELASSANATDLWLLPLHTPSNSTPRLQLQRMFDNVTVLALAAIATQSRAYASKAVEWLEVWFIRQTTRLNPTLKGPKIPNGEYPSGYPVANAVSCLDLKPLYYVLDAVTLLVEFSALNSSEHHKIKEWCKRLIRSLMFDKYGQLAWKRTDHHGLFLRLALLSLSNFVKDWETLTLVIYEFNPLLVQQLAMRNRTLERIQREMPTASCRRHISCVAHGWLLALSMTRRLGVRLNGDGICSAVLSNLAAMQQCPEASSSLGLADREQELVVRTGWRSVCATSENLLHHFDVAGSTFPLSFPGLGIPPYWNLVSPM